MYEQHRDNQAGQSTAGSPDCLLTILSCLLTVKHLSNVSAVISTPTQQPSIFSFDGS